MTKELSQNSKLPAFMAMLHEDKKRIKEMEQILNAPDYLLSEGEKESKAEALLLKYEREVEALEKWNNFVQLDCKGFEEVVFKIEKESPYKHKTLLIFNLLLNSINRNGKSSYNAQSLAEKLDCPKDTVWKCLKWLRENNIIVDKKEGTKSPGLYIMSNRGEIYLSDWLVRKRRSFKRDQEQKLAALTKELTSNGKQPSFFKSKYN